LREGGHQVFAPTLRGSEDGDVDRVGITLTAMGAGLVAQIKREGLRDLVLVGHSGGGPVIQYAADRLMEITRRAVFAGAWVLRDGESIHDVLPTPFVENGRAAAALSADSTIPMDPSVWKTHFMNGATDEQLSAVIERLVPVPLGWLEEPIALPRFWSADLPASYIFFRNDHGPSPQTHHEMARRLANPRIVQCDGPHEAMLTHPDAVAQALVTAAKD